jgi:glycogen synthase
LQLDPIKPKLKSPGTKRLNPKIDILLSTSAFKSNLRRYIKGFIGRLDWQKGPDVIRDSIQELMGEDVQVVMLGSGLAELEQFMQTSEAGAYTGSLQNST